VFDPEVEFVRIGADGLGLVGEWRGLDALTAAMATWMREWTDVRFQAQEFIEVGDRVLVLARESGIGKHSGARLDHLEASVFELRDGRIVRWEAYWDPAEAMSSLGIEE
jgi:ketosteroid isomerase-like protein